MKGAIFDMDGLMFDTERLWQKNWHAIADEMGVELDPQFGKDICGTNGKLMNQVIEKYYHVEDGGPIAKDCTNRVHADLEKEVPEKPGIHEILKWLKENNFRIAVASSSPRPLIERNLKMTDTLQYIDVCCSGTEVKHGKPAPDLFLHAAELIGLPAEECYIFEDAYNGIRAAYSAGGKPIMVPDIQEPDNEMKEKAHAICTTLLDALEVLKKENA